MTARKKLTDAEKLRRLRKLAAEWNKIDEFAFDHHAWSDCERPEVYAGVHRNILCDLAEAGIIKWPNGPAGRGRS